MTQETDEQRTSVMCPFAVETRHIRMTHSGGDISGFHLFVEHPVDDRSLDEPRLPLVRRLYHHGSAVDTIDESIPGTTEHCTL